MNADRAPLVPENVDLRDFAFLPLEGRRLLTSDSWILGTAEERCAALALWIEAWYQVPAASLPDNDRALAHLSQAGARWPKVKAHALRGWAKATDGRLYHAVLAEKALDAWERKQAQRGRTAAARAARQQQRQQQSPPTAATTSVTETVTSSKGQGQGHRKNRSPQTPGAAAAARKDDLHYPEKLANGQRSDVDTVVALLDDRGAQIVLDELDGAMRYGRKPVSDPIALLTTLVASYRAGTFAPSHAGRVGAEREGREVKIETAAARARDDNEFSKGRIAA